MTESTKSGWDAVDDRSMDTSPIGDQWRHKFAIEAGETRRVLFLDAVPFTAYFHMERRMDGGVIKPVLVPLL